jgi:hypothetical protein
MHVYITLYLLMQIFKAKYDHIWPTQKRVNGNLYFVNSTKSNHCSVNWTVCHFHVDHIESYFFLENLHKCQGNMYMQNFITIFF